MATASPLLWLAIGGMLLTAGDVVYKVWIARPSMVLYAEGLLLYVTGLCCLVQSFKSENMAVATAIFVIVNIVTLAIVSWLCFGEKLSSQQLAGLGFAGVAVMLLR